MKRRNQIWECLFPTFFILLMLVVATLIITILGSLLVTLIGLTGQVAVIWYKVSNLITTLLAFLMTLFFLRNVFRYDAVRFGYDPKRVNVMAALPAVLFTFAIGELCSTSIDLLGISSVFTTYQESAEVMFQDQNALLLILATVIAGPIAEELVFRFLTYRRIRHYLGSGRAIFLSALLFGIYHMNVVQFIFAFVIGLLFAWLYEKYGTILVPIAAHMLINLYAAIYNIEIDYIAAHPLILTWMTGIQLLLAVVTGAWIFALGRKTEKEQKQSKNNAKNPL